MCRAAALELKHVCICGKVYDPTSFSLGYDLGATFSVQILKCLVKPVELHSISHVSTKIIIYINS